MQRLMTRDDYEAEALSNKARVRDLEQELDSLTRTMRSTEDALRSEQGHAAFNRRETYDLSPPYQTPIGQRGQPLDGPPDGVLIQGASSHIEAEYSPNSGMDDTREYENNSMTMGLPSRMRAALEDGQEGASRCSRPSSGVGRVDDSTDPGSLPRNLSGSSGQGLLTGPMFTTLTDMCDRAGINDDNEWKELARQPEARDLSRLGNDRISSGELMPSCHFTGEVSRNDGGHCDAIGGGYFNMLQDYVKFIRKHCTPILWHLDAMLLWLPPGSQAQIWHTRHQHHLAGMSARCLIMEIVKAFPDHGQGHQKEEWAKLDTLGKVRRKLLNKGRQYDQQTVGDVAAELVYVATRLEVPRDELHIRLKRMGDVVADAMRRGLTERQCMGAAGKEEMLENARWSVEPLPGVFKSDHLVAGASAVPTEVRPVCLPAEHFPGVVALPVETPVGPSQLAAAAGGAFADQRVGSSNSTGMDRQRWVEEQKKQCKHCAQFGVAGGVLYTTHQEQDCPFNQSYDDFSMFTWRQLVHGAPPSAAKDRVVAEYNRRLLTNLEFTQQVAKFSKISVQKLLRRASGDNGASVSQDDCGSTPGV